MSTPFFTGNEPVFSGLNAMIPRGVDPAIAETYNPRFAQFLQAINSSEEMRSAVAAFAQSGGSFVNGYTTTEDASVLDPRLQFEPATNVIRVSDDYLVNYRGGVDGLGAMNDLNGVSAERRQLGEMIRVVGHEVSHANRNLEVGGAYNTNFQSLSAGTPNADTISAYINQDLQIGLQNEGQAYLDNWNSLVRAGFSEAEIKAVLRRPEFDAIKPLADPVTNLVDPTNPNALTVSMAYVKAQIPSGSEGSYVGYYTGHDIQDLQGRGWLTGDMPLSINGLQASDLVASGFTGQVSLADSTQAGAFTQVTVGRATGSNASAGDFQITTHNGGTVVETRGTVGEGGAHLQLSDVTIYRNGVLLYVPDPQAIGIDAKTIDQLRQDNPAAFEKVIGAETGVYVATRDDTDGLSYTLENGQTYYAPGVLVVPGSNAGSSANPSVISPNTNPELGGSDNNQSQWTDGGPMLGGSASQLPPVEDAPISQVTHLPNGFTQLSDPSGQTYYLSPQGQALSSEQYTQYQRYQDSQARTATGLMQNIAGLENWSQMDDGQKLATLMSIYNGVDALGGGQLPGNLGGATSVLGLINALGSGEEGAALYTTVALVDHFAEGAASEFIGSALNIPAANVLPILNLVLAIDSGDPVSMAAAAVAFIPGVGPFLSFAVTLLGGMFHDEPTIEGHAQASWDSQGNLNTVVTQSAEGGGQQAQKVMNALVNGLDGQVQQSQNEQGVPLEEQWGLVPTQLPQVGYINDPDGLQYSQGAQGQLTLTWTDGNGQQHTRYYDGAGQRNDGSGDTIQGDFVKYAAEGGAFAPNWWVQTLREQHVQKAAPLAGWEAELADLTAQAQAIAPQSGGSGEDGWYTPSPDPERHAQLLARIETLKGEIAQLKAELLQGSEQDSVNTLVQQAQVDEVGTSQHLNVLTLKLDGVTLPADSPPRTVLTNMDADGYLEAMQWVDANQALLGMDLNGDGLIGATELLGDLSRLDANADGVIDQRDPAYAAIRLWRDVNGNGLSSDEGETTSLQAAGITALSLGGGQVQAIMADGSVLQTQAQTLTGDVLGVAYGTHKDAKGLLVTTEQADGSGQTVLAASNTRAFDGQAEHTHGGQVVLDPAAQAPRTVGQQDIVASTHRSADANNVRTSTQVHAGDARLADGGAGQVLQGQSSGQQTVVHVQAPQIRGAEQGAQAVRSTGTDGLTVRYDAAPSPAPAPSLALDAARTLVDLAPPLAPETAKPAAELPPPLASRTLAGQTAGTQGTALVKPGQLQSAPQPPLGVVPRDAGLTDGQQKALAEWLRAARSGEQGLGGGLGQWPLLALAVGALSAASAAAMAGDTGGAAGWTEGGMPQTVLSPTQAGAKDVAPTMAAGPQATTVRQAPLALEPEAMVAAYGQWVFQALRQAAETGPAGLPGLPPDGRVLMAAFDQELVQAMQLLLRQSTDDSQVQRVRQWLQEWERPDTSWLQAPEPNPEDGPVVSPAPAPAPAPATENSAPSQPQAEAGAGESSAGPSQAPSAPTSQAPAPANLAPQGVGEVLGGVDEDTVLVFDPADLLANDVDPDGARDDLRVVALSGAEHGQVAWREDGMIVFTPDAEYAGPARFRYTIADGQGATSEASVALHFVAVNDAPSLLPDELQGVEDTVLTLHVADLLANDSDVDDPTSALTLLSVGQARHGTVALLPDGCIQFQPDAHFNGTASFRYTVKDAQGAQSEAVVWVRVAAVNDAPQAVDDVLGEQKEDVPLLISARSLLGNDVDVDQATNGQVLRIAEVHALPGQTHGTVSLGADGQVRFDPESNYVGPVAFSYAVSDGAGGLSTATCRFELVNVNDAPVVAGEVLSIKGRSEVWIDPATLLANDHDVDPTGDVLSIVAVRAAEHGEVALSPDGRIRFVAEPGFQGEASFEYVVSDGQGGESVATARLSTLNLAPIVQGETLSLKEDQIAVIDSALLLANDSDLDNTHAQLRLVDVGNATHGTVSLNAQGAIVFVPETDYFGSAQFTYTVADGDGGFSVGVATLEIEGVNDAPTVQGELLDSMEDETVYIDTAALLANDHDIDSPGPLAIVGLGQGSGGTVHLGHEARQIIFVPDANFAGQASFSYTVSDGQGGLSQAKVYIEVHAINDAPVANDEWLDGRWNQVLKFPPEVLLANDVDVDGPTELALTAAWGGVGGSVKRLPDGTVEFSPEAGFSGTASFRYTVEDAYGASSVGTTYVRIPEPNRAPVAVDDSFEGLEDVPFVISSEQLLLNDSDDRPGAELKVTAVGEASAGTVSMDAAGNVTLVPPPEFSGQITFRYTVTDADGASTQAVAYLDVHAVNDSPVLKQVWIDPSPDGQLIINGGADGDIRIANDLRKTNGAIIAQDPDGTGPLTYSLAEGPIHGHAVVTSDGFWFYVSDAIDPYEGADPFWVRATDEGGAYADFEVSVEHFDADTWTEEWSGGWLRYWSPTQYDWNLNVGTYESKLDRARETFETGVIYGENPPPPAPDGPADGIWPVAIDLDGDGVELLPAAQSPMSLDLDGDGAAEKVGWVSPDDAVLAYDKDDNGLIEHTDEFSFVGYLPGATSDLEGLAAFDSNHNGLLDAQDEQWARFGLWHDRNGDGAVDADEFESLDSAGVVSLNLSRQDDPHLRNGNMVLGTTQVLWADGHTSEATDTVFLTEAATDSVANSGAMETSSAGADDAEIARQALRFIDTINAAAQALATDNSDTSDALAFVPIGECSLASGWDMDVSVCDPSAPTEVVPALV